MTYTPIADADFVAPVAGSSTAWPALIANDAACFELYTPGLEANPSATTTSAAREFRWREYGGMDAPLVASCLVVGVRAIASSGPQTVTIATPGIDSDTVAVNGDAWYTAQLDAAGPMQEVIVSCAAPGAGTLAFSGLRSHRAYSSGAAGTLYPSGWRKVGAVWGTSGYPIPSEVQGRLATNPARLARDRPVCVAAHISDCVKAVSAKSEDIWAVYGETTWVRAGRLVVPRCDTKPRLFRVDAYTTDTTPGTASFSVKIGSGNDEQWSGVGWHSWQVELGPQRHDVWATILPGAGNGASIRTLTIWRTEL